MKQALTYNVEQTSMSFYCTEASEWTKQNDSRTDTNKYVRGELVVHTSQFDVHVQFHLHPYSQC